MMGEIHIVKSMKRSIKKSIVCLCMICSIILSNVYVADASIGSEAIYCKYTGNEYSHDSRFENEMLFTGIDVSYWNGDIDWKKVKEDGIQFAIIRCGFRELYSGRIGKDPKFEQNIKGATAEGIQVGVYFFSQATSVEEAKEEAEAALSYTADYYFSLPLVMDYEYGDGRTGRLADANLSKEEHTEICNAFAATVREANIIPMVYANKSMLNSDMIPSSLNCKTWLAHWITDTDYTGDYEFWQVSSVGRVNGIKGNVDIDFWYSNSNHARDGIDYSPVFNAREYLEKYPDLRNAFGNDELAAFEHFLTKGMDEGRVGCSYFDVYSYRGYYQDLQKAFGDDWKGLYYHFLTKGIGENRNGIPKKDVYTVSFMNAGKLVQENDVVFGHGTEGPELSREGAEFGGWDIDLECITKDVTANAKWRYYYEGREYTAVFDGDYYLEHNPDVKAVYGNSVSAALSHFITFGMKEGRQGCQDFEPFSYRGRYSDLQSAFGDDIELYYYHYLNFGFQEKRNGKYIGTEYTVTFISEGKEISKQKVAYGHGATAPQSIENSSFFEKWNTNDYRAVTRDMVVEAEWRYIYQGKDFSKLFSAEYYSNKYSDIKKAFGDNRSALLAHFVTFGMKEGRSGNASFDPYSYRGRYEDLLNAYGQDIESYYLHYLSFGYNEGRRAEPKAERYTISFIVDGETVKTETVWYGHTASAPDMSVYGDSFIGWNTNRYLGVNGNLNVVARWNAVYEGIDYAKVFDAGYYLQNNPDVKNAYGDDKAAALTHFVIFGMKEGRVSSSTFNVRVYKEKNKDLQVAFGDKMEQYYWHYLNFGVNENRVTY